MTCCQHCEEQIWELPGGHWMDDLGYTVCVKGDLWRDPITGKVERRPPLCHTPLPNIAVR